MIYYNTDNDRTAKVICKWCKDNGYIYTLNCDNDKKRSNEWAYPFTILATSDKETELKQLLNS